MNDSSDAPSSSAMGRVRHTWENHTPYERILGIAAALILLTLPIGMIFGRTATTYLAVCCVAGTGTVAVAALIIALRRLHDRRSS